MSNFKYSADIDGLRSIAVLPVVAFHLNLSFFPGGFAGVDVFFVISGFLITRIILQEIDDGSFSLVTFYKRRVLRLFPALFTVLLVTLVASYLWFLPEDLANAGQSAIAALLFVSNVLFYLEAGYFDASSYSKPLLNTWSLAIEEQFYLVMPLAMMLLARLRFRIWVFVLGLTLISFALSALTTTTYSTAAYYLLPWRAWELGLGALLALGIFPALSSRHLREIATVLGLLLIGIAVFGIDRRTPFPGSAALLPTLGAALILHAGQSGNSLVTQLLSLPIPVFIGKLSYSLYLWHWPVIVFFTYKTLDLPDTANAIALFALSLSLAWVSYTFVEKPIRVSGASWRISTVISSTVVAGVALLAVSGLFYVSRGLPDRLSADAKRIAAFSGDFHPDRFRCWARSSNDNAKTEPCVFGADMAPTVALVGDSHAGALVPTLESTGKTLGFSFVLFSHEGCPAFPDLEVYWINEDHSCEDAVRANHSWLDANSQIETIVLAVRPAMYVHGWLPYGLNEFGRSPLLIGDANGPLAPSEDRAAFFMSHMEATINHWQQQGRAVVLVYPVPEAPNKVPRGVLGRMLGGGDEIGYTMDRRLFDDRNQDIVSDFDVLVRDKNLVPVRLDKVFCEAETCSLMVDGVPVYHDSTHLSATHGRAIAPVVEEAFQNYGVLRNN